jgi:hypothetical protein
MNIRTSKYRDKALKMFKGDVTVTLQDIKDKFGYKTNAYYHIENSIKHFLAEDMVDEFGQEDNRYWKLKARGWDLYSQLDDHGDGYLRKYMIGVIKLWLVVGSFIFAGLTLLSVLLNWEINPGSHKGHEVLPKSQIEQLEQQYSTSQQGGIDNLNEKTIKTPIQQDSLSKISE